MSCMIPEEHQFYINQALSACGILCHKMTFLTRGANNLIYRLHCDNLSLIAKIGVNAKFKNLDKEYLFLNQVKDIGPEVFFFDICGENHLHVIIESFIDGYHPYQMNYEQLNNIGQKIALYHSVNHSQFIFSNETWLDFIDNRIPLIDPQKDEHSLASTVIEKKEQAKKLGFSIYKNKIKTVPVLVHGDLIPLNLIIGKDGSFKIIDWECIRYDDAESDLATLIKAFRLTDDQIVTLLQGYNRAIDKQILEFRLLLHYLQVIAWRIAVQIPSSIAAEKEKAVTETYEELSVAENLMKNFQ